MKKFLLFLSLIFIVPVLVWAQSEASFDQRVNQWNTMLDSATHQLESGVLQDKQAEELRVSLRQMRNDATQEVQSAEDLLKTKQDLLKALGDKPSPESGIKEDPAVARQREALNKDISTIDARLKQSNLVISRGQDILNLLNKSEQAEMRQQLLARDTTLYSFGFLPSIYQELSSLRWQDVQSWKLWGVIAGIALLTLVYLLKRNWLRTLTRVIPSGHKRMPAATPAYMALVSALLIWSVHSDITAETTPDLEFLIRLVATVLLSFSTGFMIRRLRVVHSENEDASASSRIRIWNRFVTLARGVLYLCIPAALAGYLNLASYLAFGSFMTLLCISAFFWLRHAADWGYVKLAKPEANADGTSLPPMAVSLLEPLFALGAVLLATHFWGVENNKMLDVLHRFSDGVSIGSITLNPADILVGLVVFAALIAVTRLIQWFMSSRVFIYTDLHGGVKDAIIALTGYAGITVAILSGLSTSGLDMSNLAIIAGALSVGIGFGLQSIFSNFVSGLILFFERPIRVGDWVIVGGNEGIVKKIRVRSTEIETFQNAAIMVPNSQFISEPVTNWTLKDVMGRLEVSVGVAYGSDTRQVYDILMKTAQEHPQVRKRPEPQVLFTDFGDSALMFEIRAYLKDIRNRPQVASEIRFTIDAEFRKAGISIPFPQRDLHLVSAVPVEVKSRGK